MADARDVRSYETKAEALSDGNSTVQFWLDQIEVAGRTEKDWMDEAAIALDLYRLSSKTAFNILFSNVQVKVPAMYNSNPEPDVRSRDRSTANAEQSEDERKASQAIDLTLRYQMDEYDFAERARSVVRDYNISGRGVGRVDRVTYTHKDQETEEEVVWEEARMKRVLWRNFRRGPGTSWEDVPWHAFKHVLTRDQLITLAGEDIGKKVSLDEIEEGAGDATDPKKTAVRERSVFGRAGCWEIWDKDTRKVFFISEGYGDGPLAIDDDPYGYIDFFPTEILQPISDPEGLSPICPYSVYRRQAEELNDISARILALTAIVKFRGIRASEISEFDQLEDLEDGEFLVSEGALALVGGAKGIGDAIWVMPILELVNTIKELILQRENIKQVIYELTGISDIMRGATDPNETLGAQQIKAQSGSLRVRDEVEATEKFCRGVLRKKAELVANKFAKETLEQIVGEELSDAVDMILRSDIRRRYSIDVETNSTIRGDLARMQQNMNQWMQGIGQFVGVFMPLIQSGSMPPEIGPAIVSVISGFTKQFKLGKQVDDTLAGLEQATKAWLDQKKNPSPEQQQEEAENKELEKRAKQAAITEAEAKAAKTQAEVGQVGATTEKTMVDAQRMRHEGRRGAATDLINIRRTKADLEKKAEEVQAQRVETAQQTVELDHKVQRGPFAPDPTAVAEAEIGAKASVATGQQKADASVQSQREKNAAQPDDEPDFDGFVA